MMALNTLPQAAQIKLLALDVDGVLTDGLLYFSEQGETLRTFHVHDGQGLKRLQHHGISVAIITARQHPMVSRRMEELGIVHIYQGVKDKAATLHMLLQQLQLSADSAAFVGDDLPDIAPMQLAGLAIAVNNAVAEVKAISHYITQAHGGHGAVREVCDGLIRAKEAVI